MLFFFKRDTFLPYFYIILLFFYFGNFSCIKCKKKLVVRVFLGVFVWVVGRRRNGVGHGGVKSTELGRMASDLNEKKHRPRGLPGCRGRGLWVEVEWRSLLLHGAGHVGGVEGEGTFSQFGSVERFEHVVVAAGAFLWQAERFAHVSAGIYVAEIGLSVEPIVAFRCEHKPSAVGAP